jgi:2-polyprenyl-6-methoxyphenol hydroxylase-like FAD-dependent oxidoreductase
MQTSDVVIVGGGIGGSALGAALAADSHDVVVLEQSAVYEDRVRGESMMPWGVAEARALGLDKVLLDAGARITPTWINYHLPDQRDEIPAGMLVPEIPGSLNLRHPEACAALEAAARRARRLTRAVLVTPADLYGQTA